MKKLPLAPLLVLLLLLGCGTTEGTVEPKTDFGQRFEDVDDEEREVLELESPPPGTEYFTYPVMVTDVRVRMGERLPDSRVPVELVILGTLPDVCTHLYQAEQRRMVQQLYIDFDMWRGKGEQCLQLARPFRYYFEFDQPLAPGPYSLHVNDSVHNFEILPPVAEVR